MATYCDLLSSFVTSRFYSKNAVEDKESYRHLDPYEESENSVKDERDVAFLLEQTRRRLYNALTLLVVIGLLFIMSNGAWLLLYKRPHVQNVEPSKARTYNDVQSLSRPLYWNTQWSSENKSVGNKLWAELFPPGQGLVSLSTSWAESLGLPSSKPDPLDDTHSVYFVAVYHQLHCLTVVRAALYHYNENMVQTVQWSHVNHCLDSLRQALMCSADDTLLYSNDSKIYGDKQLHVCRDWTKLGSWTKEHRHIF